MLHARIAYWDGVFKPAILDRYISLRHTNVESAFRMTFKTGEHESPTQGYPCHPPAAALQPTDAAPSDAEPETEKKAWEKTQSRLGEALDCKKSRIWGLRPVDVGVEK